MKPIEFRRAIERGDLEQVKQLVSADPNWVKRKFRQRPKWSPLHVAVSAGQVRIVEFLLTNGADANARTRDGIAPLYCVVPCTEEGEEFSLPKTRRIIKLLLEHGADINAKDDEGRTVLHRAAEEALLPLVKLLVRHGADIKAETADGSPPSHFAEGHDVKEFLWQTELRQMRRSGG